MLRSFKLELSYILKNKISFFVLFVAPVLVTILLGIVFSKEEITGVPFAVLNQDDSSTSRLIVSEFSNSEIFNKKVTATSIKEIEYLLSTEQINCALVIPKDFSKDLKSLSNPSVLMIYDGSNMSMSGAAKSKATEILLSLKIGTTTKIMSAKIGLSSVQSQKLAQMVSYRNNFLYNPAKSFKYFLNAGFGASMVQTCICLVAASCIRREEFDLPKITSLGYLFGKIAFYSISGTVGFVLSILINKYYANIPFRGEMSYSIILSFFMAIAVSSFSIMISSLVGNPGIANTLNAVFFIPSTIVSGYTWPTLSMPKFYQELSTFMPLSHFAANLRDLFIKGLPFSALIPDLVWLIKFSFFTTLISFLSIVLKKHKEIKAQMYSENQIAS